MDLDAVKACVRPFVVPTGPLEVVKERPWAATATVPTADGTAFFKQCASIQAFEPRLTAALADRTPDLLPRVLGWASDPPWLLTADCGAPVGDRADRLELWERVLPRYAELQRRETAFVPEHLAGGVPDRRPESLPDLYESLLGDDIPAGPADRELLRAFASGFAGLCTELAAAGVAPTVQHDDLHGWSMHVAGGDARIIDWGDTSIAHPMSSLVVVFEFLIEDGLAPDDPRLVRLRDAFLEPWGPGHAETCALAMRVGEFARAIGWVRQRDAMGAVPYRDAFDEHFAGLLHRVAARVER